MSSSSPESNKSAGSHGSHSSPSVRGIVDPAGNPSNKAKGKSKALSCSAGCTSWTLAEIEEFVKLLLSHHTSAGDNGFKEETFNKVADELNRKFPSQRVPKTGKSCRSKWGNIKSEHTLVSNIRAASGFHYDDINGAIIDNHTRAAWEGFCKTDPGAMKYEGNPWPHWNDVSPLMSVVPKRLHLHCPMKAKSKHVQKQHRALATNTSPLVTLTGTTASGALADQMAVDNYSAPTDQMAIDGQASSASGTATHAPMAHDPNSITPSMPSIYLQRPPQSTISMASSTISSVSQKWKVSSLIESNAGPSETTKKRSCPASATAQAKAKGNMVLQWLSDFLKNIGPSITQPVTLASLGLPQIQSQLPPLTPSNHTISSTVTDDNYIERAAEALMSFNLTPIENNDLANYMSDAQNKKRAMFFLKFDLPSRKLWIKNTLADIQLLKKDHDGEGAMQSDR